MEEKKKKKKNQHDKGNGGRGGEGDCKQVLRVSRSTTSLKGRPQWVHQGFCGLPSVGIPGARAGLSGEWAFRGGGEDKGRAPEIPSRWPGGHSSHITERPSPVSSVCVCVCQVRMSVSSTTSPGRGGRKGGKGRECRTLAQKGAPFPPSAHKRRIHVPHGSSRCRGRGNRNDKASQGGGQRRETTYNTLARNLNSPRTENNSRLTVTRHFKTTLMAPRKRS